MLFTSVQTTIYWQALNRLNAAVGLRVLVAQEAEGESPIEKGEK